MWCGLVGVKIKLFHDPLRCITNLFYKWSLTACVSKTSGWKVNPIDI